MSGIGWLVIGVLFVYVVPGSWGVQRQEGSWKVEWVPQWYRLLNGLLGTAKPALNDAPGVATEVGKSVVAASEQATAAAA